MTHGNQPGNEESFDFITQQLSSVVDTLKSLVTPQMLLQLFGNLLILFVFKII